MKHSWEGRKEQNGGCGSITPWLGFVIFFIASILSITPWGFFFVFLVLSLRGKETDVPNVLGKRTNKNDKSWGCFFFANTPRWPAAVFPRPSVRQKEGLNKQITPASLASILFHTPLLPMICLVAEFLKVICINRKGRNNEVGLLLSLQSNHLEGKGQVAATILMQRCPDWGRSEVSSRNRRGRGSGRGTAVVPGRQWAGATVSAMANLLKPLKIREEERSQHKDEVWKWCSDIWRPSVREALSFHFFSRGYVSWR